MDDVKDRIRAMRERLSESHVAPRPDRPVLVATDKCSSCKAPITWALTEADKNMPIDPEPYDDGNVVVTGFDYRTPTIRVLKKDEDPGDVNRYKAHFATCPFANRHRRAA